MSERSNTQRPTVRDISITYAGMSLEQYSTWLTAKASDIDYEIEPGARERETVRPTEAR